ncbi:hypothetical protein J4E86_000715 [Alternaria arbusti]|uniref:uncharacterized protein n=1 Tax=Alternaria arbusti TaxID=232088 RepID=UPI00221E665B|nr:uncharacterized protein J4E86_000715 [Alternaria arbusti]KAI4961686.1 hypothetical protein J4E86_000715 [Alternaria arbusti]
MVELTHGKADTEETLKVQASPDFAESAGSIASTPWTTPCSEAAKIKNYKRQNIGCKGSMLEQQEGYIHPAQGERESAMRSTLGNDVDNNDFTAAFILREMANSDITADPESMDFVQRLMNPSASGGTLESTNSAKKETPRESPPLRRSTRNKTAAAPGAGNSSSKIIESEQPTPEPLKLDEGEGFMPSAENDFKFKYDSASGRRAKELDALLNPPSLPKAFPADFAGEKTFLSKSYKATGTRPKKNAADDRVKEMELEHARAQQDVDMAMGQEDM